MAVGLERAYSELVGQGEGLPLVFLGRFALRKVTPCPNVTEEAQSISLMAMLLVLTGRRPRAFGHPPLDVPIIAELSRPSVHAHCPHPRMNSGSVEGEDRQVLSIGVFAAEAAVVEDDLAALDVIAKAEAPPTEAVLTAFSGRNPFEFQDIVLAAPVIWICVENGERFRKDTGKFWMLSIEAM
jgi:hypothetical protein